MKTVITKVSARQVLASLLGLSLSSGLFAGADTGTIDANSVSALAMSQSQGMLFGRVVAVGNAGGEIPAGGSLALGIAPNPGNSASIVMDLTGALALGVGLTASINNLDTTGTLGTINVTGGEANTVVRFSSPQMLDFDIEASTAPIADGVSGDVFHFTDLIMDTDTPLDGVMNNPTISDGYCCVGTVEGTTDVSGNLTVTTAGRLYTVELAAPNQTYTNAGYTGSYELTVSY